MIFNELSLDSNLRDMDKTQGVLLIRYPKGAICTCSGSFSEYYPAFNETGSWSFTRTAPDTSGFFMVRLPKIENAGTKVTGLSASANIQNGDKTNKKTIPVSFDSDSRWYSGGVLIRYRDYILESIPYSDWVKVDNNGVTTSGTVTISSPSREYPNGVLQFNSNGTTFRGISTPTKVSLAGFDTLHIECHHTGSGYIDGCYIGLATELKADLEKFATYNYLRSGSVLSEITFNINNLPDREYYIILTDKTSSGTSSRLGRIWLD